MFQRPRTGLAAKLAIILVASSAAFLGLFGYVQLREQRRHAEELVLQSAERAADLTAPWRFGINSGSSSSSV